MIKKKCRSCKNFKTLDEFYRAAKGKYGRAGQCKLCRYPVQAAYSQKRDVKARKKKYKHKYIQAHPEETRAEWNRRHKLHNLRNPDKYRARTAISNAVRDKRILPAKAFKCAYCRIGQAQQYHHHRGYDKEHWLDVVPVCKECHKAADSD